MARPIANLRLRLPDALRRKLAAEAEKSQRSLNSEILWRLGQSLGAEGASLVEEYETLDQQVKRKLNEVLERMLAERRGGA
jgi:hypothetical protein